MTKTLLVESVETLTKIDFKQFVTTVFVLMACFIALYEIAMKFIGVIKKILNIPSKAIENANKPQDLEISNIKARQDKLEADMSAIRESTMVSLWDRIKQLGKQHISVGHISYSDYDLFFSLYDAYDKNGGNGHLVRFVNRVENLPYTEELTLQQRLDLESNQLQRSRDAQLADQDLSSYYNNTAPRRKDKKEN